MVVKWSKGKPTPAAPVAGANKRKGGPEEADQSNTQVSHLQPVTHGRHMYMTCSTS